MADESTQKQESTDAEGPGGSEEATEDEAPENEAPEKSKGDEEPSARAVRFANVTLGIAAAMALSQVIFGMRLNRPTLLCVVPGVLAALLVAAYWLRPARRVTAAMVVLPAMVLTYGFEWRIARNRPYDATQAAMKGVTYDTRALWEVIRDRRAEGADAYPSFQPRALLVLDLSKGLAPDELQNHKVSPTFGVEVDGTRVLPFGGISSKRIVYCNEGGKWAEYDSDEHGFNNPKGLWAKDSLEVALIGDSFTQAACVGADENAAHWIRQRYPDTVNVAMAGNGPLIELGTLEEYIAPKRPQKVLWIYYNNDMPDLDVEKQVPLLMNYLEKDGFSQGLSGKQAGIDKGLDELAKKIDALSPRWPGALSAVGLTRASSPIWLGDLAMNERHSSASAVMRLDRLSFAFTSVAVKDVFHVEPDFALYTKVLARAKQRVESWGGKLYFVYVADMFYLQYRGKGDGPRREHFNRPGVLKAVADAGVTLIDTEDAFFNEVKDPLDVLYHMESHCNPTGYKLLGETILKKLDELGK
ncbi:MAG: hypothetical protein R3B70_10160 [Polyangiaceae bacterium]